jgi:hypothetical protein
VTPRSLGSAQFHHGGLEALHVPDLRARGLRRVLPDLAALSSDARMASALSHSVIEIVFPVCRSTRKTAPRLPSISNTRGSSFSFTFSTAASVNWSGGLW